jgi:ketose-bisphosphate aldolase
MLVNFNYLLEDAEKRNYGVGIIEAWDNFTIQAAVEAAIEEKSPSAVMAWKYFIEKIGIETYADIALSYINSTDVPIALCLDECQDFSFILKCIKAGFSFVMHDGGAGEYGDSEKLDYNENVKRTKEIVKIAHALNVTVEASLGEVPLAKEGKKKGMETGSYTDLDQAYDFVKKTGIDILAPSIGNIHGLYKEKWPEPDWELAKKLVDTTGVPCALHGSSGASDEQLRKAISVGFRKINIATRYNEIYRKTLFEEISKCEGYACPFNSCVAAAEEFKNEAKRLMREVYNSSGKC